MELLSDGVYGIEKGMQIVQQTIRTLRGYTSGLSLKRQAIRKALFLPGNEVSPLLLTHPLIAKRIQKAKDWQGVMFPSKKAS